MKQVLLLIACLLTLVGWNQKDLSKKEQQAIAEITVFQEEQNQHYLDSTTSPLKPHELAVFEGHHFYPINLEFAVTAKFERISDPDTIVMPTSAGTEKMFAKYAKLSFKIGDSVCVLFAYQNLKVIKMEGYENSLFVPFTDETTGAETYGGGRYLDLEIPKKKKLILNFNLAYNPYCAYTTGWFCPIPPKENTLNVAIKAGLMKPIEH